MNAAAPDSAQTASTPCLSSYDPDGMGALVEEAGFALVTTESSMALTATILTDRVGAPLASEGGYLLIDTT